MRLEKKQTILHQIQEQLNRVALSELPENDKLKNELFREIVLKGTFSSEEFHVWMGTLIPGGKPGMDVLMPFKLADGRWILIDRGWVELSQIDAGKRLKPTPNKVYSIHGILLEGEKKPMVAVKHQLDKNTWFWFDIQAMSAHSHKTFLPFYIRELKDAGVSGPVEGYIKGDKEIRLRNDHLQYAITWYLVSIAVVVIYFVYRRQQSGQKNQKTKS